MNGRKVGVRDSELVSDALHHLQDPLLLVLALLGHLNGVHLSEEIEHDRAVRQLGPWPLFDRDLEVFVVDPHELIEGGPEPQGLVENYCHLFIASRGKKGSGC